MLHGANVGRLGARLCSGADALFNQNDRNSAQPELDGDGQSDRACANDDHARVNLRQVLRHRVIGNSWILMEKRGTRRNG
jgi:hypothetical protein